MSVLTLLFRHFKMRHFYSCLSPVTIWKELLHSGSTDRRGSLMTAVYHRNRCGNCQSQLKDVCKICLIEPWIIKS